MKLSIGERIMILRIRKGMTKGQLGEAAFPGLLAPNVKMKKLESGLQPPSDEDIKAIAGALGIKENILLGIESDYGGAVVSQNIVDQISAVSGYVEIFNNLAALGQWDVMDGALDAMCSDKSIRAAIQSAAKGKKTA